MSQQINLFNPIFLKKKKYFTASAMAPALGLLLAGVAMLVVYAQRNVAELERDAKQGKAMMEAREARKTKAMLDFAPRHKSTSLDAEIDAASLAHENLQDVAAVLRKGNLGNTNGYSQYFRAVASKPLNGLWLTGISITDAGNVIGLQGRALQASLVPEYIGSLSQDAIMKGKTFARLDIAQAPSKNPATSPTPAGASVAAPPYLEFSLQSSPAAVPGAATK